MGCICRHNIAKDLPPDLDIVRDLLLNNKAVQKYVGTYVRGAWFHEMSTVRSSTNWFVVTAIHTPSRCSTHYIACLCGRASVFNLFYSSSYIIYTHTLTLTYTHIHTPLRRVIVYISTMTRLLRTRVLLRFTRPPSPPPSSEIIFDRIRDESRPDTTVMRVGWSDWNFNSFLCRPSRVRF